MIRRFWNWLNTPNELRWGEGLEWRPQAPKPTLGAAIVRLLDHP
jgi:hypothetical protein